MRTARLALLVAMMGSVLALVAAALTASAGESKVAVCHFTGNPEVINGPDLDGDLVPDWVDVLHFGQIIEVAEPAAVNLAAQGDVAVPLDYETQVVKGDLCHKGERFDLQGNLVFCHVIILGNGGANIVEFDCD